MATSSSTKSLVLMVCMLCALTFVNPVQAEGEEPCPLLRATGASESDKTGCFIVNLRDDTSKERFQEILRRVAQLSVDHKIFNAGQKVTKYITAKVSDYNIETIRRLPGVNFVEEETFARGDQVTASQVPWHADRIDQRNLPLTGRYDPLSQGEGVDIYIFDSGIRYDHEEFEYRAKYSGFDPLDVLDGTTWRGGDCHGHGTHVSSLAAGKTFGTAKKAQLYSVRVLDCTNAGPWSAVLDGLNHAMDVIEQRKRPAVISMSLSGGYTRSVNDAIERVHRAGIPIVVAAGNQFADSCQRTPAGSPYAITVGGSSINDGIYGFTNFGPCVDIFAPGSNIVGADHTCRTCSKTISGTSMSAPMVTGAVAAILSKEPLTGPADMKTKLVNTASSNKLNFGSIPFSFRSRTANKLLHIPGNCGGYFSATGSPTRIRSPVNPPNNLASYPPNLYCQWTIVARPGEAIQLDFTSFFVERLYDVVRICEGFNCVPETQVVALSGQPAVRNYRSRGGVLTIVMETDGLNELQGFQAQVVSTGAALTTTPTPPVTTPTVFSPRATTAPPTTRPPLTTPPPTTLSPATVATTTIAMTTGTPTGSPVTTPPTTDTCNTDSSQFPVLFNEFIQEASVVIQKAVADSLAGLLENRMDRMVGLVSTYPANNCSQIAKLKATKPSLASGLYWVSSSNGTSVQVYCDLDTTKCACDRTPGWMKVADVDMRDPSQTCASGLRLWDSPVRSCGRMSADPGCSSTFLATNGIPYQRVCGRVIGYQFSSPNAFYAHQFDDKVTLDEYYVDGVSLTYGWPRKHIWTFAAARSEVDVTGHICPCINSAHRLPSSAVPEFVGTNFTCDTGSSARYENGRFYDNDPLWDGSGCGPNNSCCGQLGTGYFCTDLGEPRTDDIELRICGNEGTDNEDTPIEIVNVYVQ